MCNTHCVFDLFVCIPDTSRPKNGLNSLIKSRVGRRIPSDSRISHRIDQIYYPRVGFGYATIQKSSDIRIGYRIFGSLLFQLSIAIQ